MAEAECELLEIRLMQGGLGGLIECPPAMQPGPGQYLLASAAGLDELLPTPLLRAGRYPVQPNPVLEVAPPLPKEWSAGIQLQVRGPLGRGFSLPSSARAVALAVLDHSPERIMPLLWQALAQDAEVALYTDDPPERIPPTVEVLPLSLLPEVLHWAHYLAMDIAIEQVDNWRNLLNLSFDQRCPFPAEVLIRAPVPCGGRAMCGVCSIRTRNGWQLVCRDGPVFPISELN